VIISRHFVRRFVVACSFGRGGVFFFFLFLFFFFFFLFFFFFFFVGVVFFFDSLRAWGAGLGHLGTSDAGEEIFSGPQ